MPAYLTDRGGGVMSADLHGDYELHDDSARYFCRTHGWVTVRRMNSAIYFTDDHKLGCLPTLDTVAVAVDLMRALVSAGHGWVSVFWDRGWGDGGEIAEISIIEGGNGQNPRALITPEVYAELCSDGLIKPNSLQTYKARRVHDFAEQSAAMRS